MDGRRLFTRHALGLLLAALVPANAGAALLLVLQPHPAGLPDWFMGLAFALLSLCSLLACALVANRLLRRMRRRLNLSGHTSRAISQAILLNQDIEAIYELILSHLISIFPHVRYGSVLVPDQAGILRFAAQFGFSADYIQEFQLPMDECFLYRQTDGLMDRTALIAGATIRNAPRVIEPENLQYRSIISAPLRLDGKLVGLLNLDSPERRTFDAEDVQLVEQFRLMVEVSLLARSRYQASIGLLNVDSLTGLATRRFFEELFAMALDRAERYGESFLLAMFDVDHLKTVNDRYGHLAGDQLLLGIANALRATHRRSDLLGRYGGDEFIGLYHAADPGLLRQAINRVRKRLATHAIDIGENGWYADFCFGLASYPADGRSLQELVAAADRELYRMKAARPSHGTHEPPAGARPQGGAS